MRRHSLTTLPLLLIAAGGLVVGLAVPAAAREASHLINGKSIAIQSIPGNRLKVNTLTGRQIKESTLGTVPSAKTAGKALTLPPLKWHAIKTFANGWGNYTPGVTNRPAAYAVDAEGFVHLRGVISGGTASEVAFTMPAADLPASGAQVQVPVSTHAASTSTVLIESSGVEPVDGNDASGDATIFCSLDGIEFIPKA